MNDKVFEGFLKRQFEDGMALARDSDLLDLTRLEGEPPTRYVAQFYCKGLVRDARGEISEADRFMVGVRFPPDYLRRADAFQVLTWLAPRHIWHPNISNKAPLVCVGQLNPGTSLVDILYQLFEIITYNKVTMREDDALNKEACSWSRHNMDRFPVDRRPLKRRVLDLDVKLTSKATQT